MSELWWIAVVPNAVKAVATRGLTYTAPQALKVLGAAGTASQIADMLNDMTVTAMVGDSAPQWAQDAANGFDYWWPKVMGSAWTTYPVMRFAPQGSASFTLHLLGPGGTK